MKNEYVGMKVLVTGGLGFIGSNIAAKLAELGAYVTIIDSLNPNYGGNLFNINEIQHKVKLKIFDINNFRKTLNCVKNQDLIFHCASQTNHILWRENPFQDLRDNVSATLTLAEACRRINDKVRIIYTGTRGEYGSHLEKISEKIPTNPLGFYELTKYFSGKILELYGQMYDLDYIWTRLTNIYGPRAQMKTNTSGVVNWFVRLALDEKEIPLYNKGVIKRDLLYIDDCVDALIKLGLSTKAKKEIFNVASGKSVSLFDVAKTIVSISSKGKIIFKPFDKRRLSQEPGDIFLDVKKLKTFISWNQKVNLKEGIKKTVLYYKKFKHKYW